MTTLAEKYMEAAAERWTPIPRGVANGGGDEFQVNDQSRVELMTKGDDTVYVQSIFTNPMQRGNGSGSQALHELVGLADELQVNLKLIAMGPFAEDNHKLVEWYTKNGFEYENDKHHALVREPLNMEAIKAQLDADPMSLRDMPYSVQNNKEVAQYAVEKDGMALEFVSDSLKKDPAIMIAAVTQNPEAIQFEPDSIKQEVVEALKSPEFKDNPEVQDLLKDQASSKETGKEASAEKSDSTYRSKEVAEPEMSL